MVNDDTYGTRAAAAAAKLHKGMLHAAAAHAGSGTFFVLKVSGEMGGQFSFHVRFLKRRYGNKSQHFNSFLKDSLTINHEI